MGGDVKRSKPMRQKSVKRQLADAELRAATEQRRRFTRDWCEAPSEFCGITRPHRGQHAHHVRRRSQGGGHEFENLRWLCFDAHRHVHDHPQQAAEHGLLVLRETFG